MGKQAHLSPAVIPHISTPTTHSTNRSSPMSWHGKPKNMKVEAAGNPTMATNRIRCALEEVIEFLREHPEEGRVTDNPATAVLEDGLRVQVSHPATRS